MADKLDTHLYTIGDPLRDDLAGQMIEALTTLPDEALQRRRGRTSLRVLRIR